MKNLILLFACTALTACSKNNPETPTYTAAYKAACYGKKIPRASLHGAEVIAAEEGYLINKEFSCIDKSSYQAAVLDRARWLDANTPAAKAKRQAEFEAEQKRYQAQLERDNQERVQESALEEAKIKQEIEAMANTPLILVDVNTATEQQIANVITVGPEVAAQVLAERNKRPFIDWADLINRVIGLSAAQSAVFASICGLNVNGKSLEGAPPDSQMAAQLYQKYKSRT